MNQNDIKVGDCIKLNNTCGSFAYSLLRNYIGIVKEIGFSDDGYYKYYVVDFPCYNKVGIQGASILSCEADKISL